MKVLFKELKPHWKILIIMLIAHLFRAYTTLLLPTYTSGLVDTGIQNEGFEYAVPLAITEEDASLLNSLLLPEEQGAVSEAFETESQNVITIKDEIYQNEEEMLNLQSILELPLAVMHNFNGLSETEQSEIISELESVDTSNPQTMEALRVSIVPELEAYGDQHIRNSGIQASLALFKATGLSTESIQFSYLLSNGSKMLGISLVTIASAIIGFYIASKVAADVGKGLRSKIFRKTLYLSDHEIDKFSTASLITRTTNDIQQVTLVLTVFLRAMLFAPILAVGGLIYITTLQSSMTWILALSIVLIGIFVVVLFALTMPKYKVVQDLFDRVNLIAREILTGLQVIRAFGRQKVERKRFDRANKALQKNHLFTGRTMSMMMPFMLFILDANSVLVVWFASRQIAGGMMQVGEMMAFISYSMQVLMSFLMVSSMSIMFPRALVSLRRVEEVIESPLQITNPENPIVIEQPKGVVRFEEVAFAFDDADSPIVEEISFTAKPGETTAIIGSTGSGKSTLLNLLMRFFDVTEGKITIDGVDIRDLTLEQLHDMIGYVPQQGILFSGTIENNIGYSGQDINKEEIKRAAAIAHASEFIEDKAAGYQSSISQGGSNVSGGQKQRLSIARAIAADPQIYLFDDSFSALDYRTDASLRKALNEEVGEAAVIIVAQRISTILDAEQIIVLDEGRIDGIGNHVELMEQSTVYREIAESQLSQAELDQQAQKHAKSVNPNDLQLGWEG